MMLPKLPKSLVELFEVYPAGPLGRAIVARFASRWFVLLGRHPTELSAYGVTGPYERHVDAQAEAASMHAEGLHHNRRMQRLSEE